MPATNYEKNTSDNKESHAKDTTYTQRYLYVVQVTLSRDLQKTLARTYTTFCSCEKLQAPVISGTNLSLLDFFLFRKIYMLTFDECAGGDEGGTVCRVVDPE